MIHSNRMHLRHMKGDHLAFFSTLATESRNSENKIAQAGQTSQKNNAFLQLVRGVITATTKKSKSLLIFRAIYS